MGLLILNTESTKKGRQKLNNSEIIHTVLSKNNSKIFLTLPRDRQNALSARQLGKACKIPQTTIYRITKQISKWDNIGQVEIPTGPCRVPELHFYLKSDFIIQFKNGKTKLLVLNRQND